MNEPLLDAVIIACGEDGIEATIHLVNAWTSLSMHYKHPPHIQIIVPSLFAKPSRLGILERLVQNNIRCKDVFRFPWIELHAFSVGNDSQKDISPPFKSHGLFTGKEGLSATSLSFLSQSLANGFFEGLENAIKEANCYIAVGNAEGATTFLMLQSILFLSKCKKDKQRAGLFCHIKEPINTKMFLQKADTESLDRIGLACDPYALALAMHAYIHSQPRTSDHDDFLQVSPEAMGQERTGLLEIEAHIVKRLRFACLLLFELYPQLGSQAYRNSPEKLQDSVFLAQYCLEKDTSFSKLSNTFLELFYALLERESLFCKCMHELSTATSQKIYARDTLYKLAGFQNAEAPERSFPLSSVCTQKDKDDKATLASVIDNIKIERKGMDFKKLMNKLYKGANARRM